MNTKTLAVLLGAGLCLTSPLAQAYDNRSNHERLSYGFWNWKSLDNDINHLNRMVGHVRWELGRYRAGKGIWRDYAEIRRDVERINARYRTKNFDRREMRRSVDSAHSRLHDLEVRIKAKSNDHYRWH